MTTFDLISYTVAVFCILWGVLGIVIARSSWGLLPLLSGFILFIATLATQGNPNPLCG